MPLIQISLIEGTLSNEQKQEMIEKVTDAVVSVEGEPLRPYCWVLLQEVKSGQWGVGGQGVTTEAIKALAAGEPAG
jgi:4-oxalocrotonate tautomerase